MDTMQIIESELGKLQYDMPIIHFIPVCNKKWDVKDEYGNITPDPQRAIKRFDQKGKEYYSKQELLEG